MNIVIKKQILEQMDKMLNEPELAEALERIITEAVLKRVVYDVMYACKIKEALQ